MGGKSVPVLLRASEISLLRHGLVTLIRIRFVPGLSAVVCTLKGAVQRIPDFSPPLMLICATSATSANWMACGSSGAAELELHNIGGRTRKVLGPDSGICPIAGVGQRHRIGAGGW